MESVYWFSRRMTPIRKLLMMKAVTGGGSATEYTATGNPVTFETNVSKPLKSLMIPWTPTQTGSGDPSPENVRPITGLDGLTVYASGADTSDPTSYPVTFPAEAGTVYGGTLDLTTGELMVEWEQRTIGELGFTYDITTWGGRFGATVSRMEATQNVFSAEIYCPIYKPKSSGISTSNYVICRYNQIIYIRDERYSDTESFTSANGDVPIIYPLATPLTYQLTPSEITTLIGDNTVWTDTNGENIIKYLKKG